MGFHFLHFRIMHLRKSTVRLDCIDLENDFYLIKFRLIEDYEKVLKKREVGVGGGLVCKGALSYYSFMGALFQTHNGYLLKGCGMDPRTRPSPPPLIYNKKSIASIIREGYMSLFETSKTSASISIWNVTSWASILKKEEGETLNGQITREEVKARLWSMKPFKVPGPDGMHSEFY